MADRAADDGNVHGRVLREWRDLLCRGALREEMAPRLGSTYRCFCFRNAVADRDVSALGPVHARSRGGLHLLLYESTRGRRNRLSRVQPR